MSGKKKPPARCRRVWNLGGDRKLTHAPDLRSPRNRSSEVSELRKQGSSEASLPGGTPNMQNCVRRSELELRRPRNGLKFGTRSSEG
eukprot:12577000-Alexandrium_andersonii.AAC.1